MLSKADTNQPVLLVSKKNNLYYIVVLLFRFLIVDENGYREWKIQACRCK